ncbi:unnamed protein product [Larinioides sclopetarius]|uniref:Fibrinogen C-terminal domain-containing protein n=1 Tax=Larinioides sclopetarius TaxID=280406 RepID=A0AAV2A5H4_9ARAC
MSINSALRPLAKNAIVSSNFQAQNSDSMSGEHGNRKFTTKDQDNDDSKDINCAQKHKGGWWYSSCLAANLNGLYLEEKHEVTGIGLYWSGWRVTKESLEATEMKIRPKNFRKS